MLQTPNPKPQTPNPKPQTPHPKPLTPTPKTQIPHATTGSEGETVLLGGGVWAGCCGWPVTNKEKMLYRRSTGRDLPHDRDDGVCIAFLMGYVITMVIFAGAYSGTSFIKSGHSENTLPLFLNRQETQ